MKPLRRYLDEVVCVECGRAFDGDDPCDWRRLDCVPEGGLRQNGEVMCTECCEDRPPACVFCEDSVLIPRSGDFQDCVIVVQRQYAHQACAEEYEQRVGIAIRCALTRTQSPSFVQWAEDWLDGKERSEEAAAAAAMVARAAAMVASSVAARVAAYAAYAAAMAAVVMLPAVRAEASEESAHV